MFFKWYIKNLIGELHRWKPSDEYLLTKQIDFAEILDHEIP